MPNDSQRLQGEQFVIGITGRIGSGKTSVGKYLESNYNFQYIRYSQVLSDWLAKDDKAKAQLQEVGWKVMAGGMQSELNRRLIAQTAAEGDVAVDGLRHLIDYESLHNFFQSSFHLVYIDSSFERRWEHLRANARYTDVRTFGEADAHVVEQHIESLRTKASLVIKNEGALRDLYMSVDEALRLFGKEGHK